MTAKNKLSSVRWVVQDNLIYEGDRNAMKEACDKLGIEFFPIQVIPFSTELPFIKMDEKVNVYYGSTVFINNVDFALRRPHGVFYNASEFNMMNYVQRWGKHMLNSNAQKTTFQELVKQELPLDGDLFIRPDADDKSFDGTVMTFSQMRLWYEKISTIEDAEAKEGVKSVLKRDTPIVVGPAYNVEKEWRNFIVDGRIVSSSLYRKNFKLHKSAVDIPESMLAFTHERCRQYELDRVFVMDVALCGGDYYIIECGCLNSAGFYHANVERIIESVSLAALQ